MKVKTAELSKCHLCDGSGIIEIVHTEFEIEQHECPNGCGDEVDIPDELMESRQ